jgi:hypothetical protein
MKTYTFAIITMNCYTASVLWQKNTVILLLHTV